MVLFVPPEGQEKVRDEVRSLIHVPFRFDVSGSQLIYYNPQEDLSAAEQERKSLPIQQSRELESIAAGEAKEAR